MQKNTMFKILNPILAVFTVSQALSAIFRDHLSREVFQWVHKGGGTLLLVGIGLHVILNWSWVRASVLPHRRR
jgi:hypothetical protein